MPLRTKFARTNQAYPPPGLGIKKSVDLARPSREHASAGVHVRTARRSGSDGGLWSAVLALAGTVLNRELPAVPVRIVKPQSHMRRARRCRADLVAGIFQFYAVVLQHLERFV